MSDQKRFPLKPQGAVKLKLKRGWRQNTEEYCRQNRDLEGRHQNTCLEVEAEQNCGFKPELVF